MKIKILIYCFTLSFSFFQLSANSICTLKSCCYDGPRKIGKIYIVNENNQIINNAIVWKLFSSTDSLKSKRSIINKNELDTNAYYIWSNTNYKFLNGNIYSQNKKFRIQAEGYADIVVNNLSFVRNKNLPEIYITMYPKKYLNKGNLLTLMNEYVCEKKLEIKDSVRLTFNDYNESERKGNSTAEAIRIANNIIKTYPNPVKDKLFIEVNADLTKPYNYKITDILGNELNENLLIEQKTIVNMEWQVAGIYIISVYNSEEEMLYSLKFIKTE